MLRPISRSSARTVIEWRLSHGLIVSGKRKRIHPTRESELILWRAIALPPVAPIGGAAPGSPPAWALAKRDPLRRGVGYDSRRGGEEAT
jgi:hypothetical protein